MYLCYFLLVPVYNVYVGGFGLQRNLVNLVLLLAFFVQLRKLQINAKIFYPFILLFFLQLLQIPFQGVIPIDLQFNACRQECMSSIIFPLVLWNVAQKDVKYSKLVSKVFIACIAVVTLYGLFLTTMPGVNPYIQVMLRVMGGEFNEAYAAGNSGLTTMTSLNSYRLFGRISSTFTHPMAFGLFLSLSVVYCYMRMNYEKGKMPLLVFVLTVADVFVCGIRTPIAVFFILLLFYLLYMHRIKTAAQIALACLVGMLIIHTVPTLDTLISSIFDSKGGDVGGSSINMRINQLAYCFDILGEDFLFGKGYAWTTFYLSGGRTHPLLLAFESLAFVVLCNNGVVGVIIWILSIIVLFKVVCGEIASKDGRIFVWAVSLAYFAYSMITGEYGYMKYYILFYTMIFLQLRMEKERSK